ncbi:hypothetical protein Trydic_g7880 [Trypoxylus dichotomus]
MHRKFATKSHSWRRLYREAVQIQKNPNNINRENGLQLLSTFESFFHTQTDSNGYASTKRNVSGPKDDKPIVSFNMIESITTKTEEQFTIMAMKATLTVSLLVSTSGEKVHHY